jgi:hypothetical protein
MYGHAHPAAEKIRENKGDKRMSRSEILNQEIKSAYSALCQHNTRDGIVRRKFVPVNGCLWMKTLR